MPVTFHYSLNRNLSGRQQADPLHSENTSPQMDWQRIGEGDVGCHLLENEGLPKNLESDTLYISRMKYTVKSSRFHNISAELSGAGLFVIPRVYRSEFSFIMLLFRAIALSFLIKRTVRGMLEWPWTIIALPLLSLTVVMKYLTFVFFTTLYNIIYDGQEDLIPETKTL